MERAVLARFGELALQSDDLDEILTEACRVVGQAMGTHLAKVMELQERGHSLLVRAGIGWNAGVVGEVTIQTADDTSEALALRTGQPMISPDIETETRFKYPRFLVEHGVRAVANVVIIGGHGRPPFGILQVDSREPRQFTHSDTNFLLSYANLIAAAVDRIRVVTEMRDGAERLRLALEAGNLGSWEIDLTTGAMIATSRVLEILGYAEPPAGWDYNMFLAQIMADDRNDVASTFTDAVQNSSEWHFECRGRRADDTAVRWIEGYGKTAGRESGERVRMLGILADVTERKSAETELRNSRSQLEVTVAARTRELMAANEKLRDDAAELEAVEATLRQSRKMEAVGQLTGGIAHDFNNLLGSIAGSQELMSLRTKQGRTEDLDRYVDAAMSGVRRAVALTHRLLAFSRRQTLDPKAIEINQLVETMEDMFRRTIGPATRLLTSFTADLWPARCDRNQLENALLNLVINARDAMADDGSITIETSNSVLTRQRSAADAALSSLPDGEYVALSVSDTGVGMSADVLEHAFDPFYTTKPPGQGTGLGLSMIHGFAKQSGGHVVLTSAAGQGTQATIFLPRYVGAVEQQAERTAHVRLGSSRGAVVLVVEDELPMRAVIVELLTEAGFVVLEAGTAGDGLNILSAQHGIDLLVTDVGLPGGMNGRQFADAARHGQPDLKVLFITGYAQGAAVGDGLLESGMQVMNKPFGLDAFADRVQEMIAA